MKRNKISDSILDRMCAKMKSEEAKVTPRTCWVASAIPCGKHTARVIVSSFEPFGISDAVNAVHENLSNKVIPYAPSFTPLMSEAHPTMVFASIHCYKSPEKIRPADEANMAKCNAITASTYLDVELGNVWERKEIEGKQYLVRANDDDLDTVMQMALTASVATTSRVDASGFFVEPKVGDYITFFATESTDLGTKPFIDVARVTEVTAGSVGISIEEGGHSASAYIPTPSVVNILEGAALDGNMSRRDIINFLKECYGPEYAKYLDTLK